MSVGSYTFITLHNFLKLVTVVAKFFRFKLFWRRAIFAFREKGQAASTFNRRRATTCSRGWAGRPPWYRAPLAGDLGRCFAD